jgi:hypothetical protein
MKKFSMFLILVLSTAVSAQQQPAEAPNAPHQFTNLSERQLEPTYSDLYCSGFVSKENVPATNHIVAGYNAPHETRYSTGEFVYLIGSGYAAGNRYSVLRKVRDPNGEQMFPGQNRRLKDAGIQYADLGRVAIVEVQKDIAVAKIEFSCMPFTDGDLVIPFQERPEVKFRESKTKFQEFQPFSGKGGFIIGAREFDQVLGTGAKIYVNIGASKGLHPGDYIRITRNYDPKTMQPVDRLSLYAMNSEDTSLNPPKVSSSELKKLPYRGVGEAIVLSVTPETATAMITFALEDIQVGDTVEISPTSSQQ